MNKRINKAKLIKKYFGDVIKEEGFEYIGADAGTCNFFRQKGNVRQKIILMQHRFFPEQVKLLFYTNANGWMYQEIGDFLPQYKSQEYWEYHSEAAMYQAIIDSEWFWNVHLPKTLV